MIEFDGVTKTYANGTTAVRELNLQVEAGSLTVFVGPSGCGKTTSMRMINAMITPTAGVIRVDGRDVSKGSAVRLRRGIGYVIQSGGLLPHRTVVDNVATVPVLTGAARRAARTAALGLLEQVGLDPELAQRYPAQLSGGQQQRVGVARALAADPPILLMDEPFSAVDPVVRAGLQDQMRRLQARLHKTIVFVTHDIDEAIGLGDRLAVFGTGGVLQQYDEPQRVLAAPATDFVAELVGRDRGYRGLSFRSAHAVPVHPIHTVRADEVATLELTESDWALVLTDTDRARGWIDARGATAVRGGRDVADAIASVGSLYRPAESLRQALDAAISSPAGIGVAVDEHGRVLGGMHAREVLDQLMRQRRDERAPDGPPA